MRKLKIALAAVVLTAASVALTLYIARHTHSRGSGDVAAGVPVDNTKPPVSPLQIIQKATEPVVGVPTDQQAPPSSEANKKSARESVIYHDWRPGTAKIADAQALTEKGDFIAPVWSPTSLDIAFTKSDYSGVFLAPGSATGPIRLLTDDLKPQSRFIWNPDGMSLRLQETDGQPVEVMITGEKYPGADTRPKVYELNDHIYVREENGPPARISGSQDRFLSPVLSPDETMAFFLGRETGLYFVVLDTNQVVAVGPGENPAWLPDSSGIVYDIPVSDGATFIEADLWYAAMDGSERTNLTNTPGIRETHPAVSPDGERIAFTSNGVLYAGKFIHQPAQSH